MAGHRFRIDCSEFCRKLSLHHGIPPKWSLEAAAASKLILDDPWMLPDAHEIKLKVTENSVNEKWQPANLEICKDVHRKIVEIGLVKILST